jgi:hypothetical protein
MSYSENKPYPADVSPELARLLDPQQAMTPGELGQRISGLVVSVIGAEDTRTRLDTIRDCVRYTGEAPLAQLQKGDRFEIAVGETTDGVVHGQAYCFTMLEPREASSILDLGIRFQSTSEGDIEDAHGELMYDIDRAFAYPLRSERGKGILAPGVALQLRIGGFSPETKWVPGRRPITAMGLNNELVFRSENPAWGHFITIAQKMRPVSS